MAVKDAENLDCQSRSRQRMGQVEKPAGLELQRRSKPRSKVAQTAQTDEPPLHVASLMDFSHLSNTPSWRNISKTSKGVSCSWEENVKHNGGHKAVFTELGASTSQMTVARFLDTSSRLPWHGRPMMQYQPTRRCICQMPPEFLRLPENECPQVCIWMRLPPSRRPKQWDGIEEPVGSS